MAVHQVKNHYAGGVQIRPGLNTGQKGVLYCNG